MTDRPAYSRRTAAIDALATLAVALAVYGSLRQGTFYGVDGWGDLRRIAAGDYRSDMHLLYQPTMLALARVGERLGVSLYDCATWFAAAGTAIGVALSHLAFARLGLARRRCVLATALVGTAPAVLFFATVVERHGPFFAYAGLCAWAAARFARSFGAAAAVGFGLSLALAYCAHSTGVLMAAFLLPMVAAAAVEGRYGAPVPWRRALAVAMLAGVVALAAIAAARALGLWLGQTITAGGNFEFFMALLRHNLARPAVAVTSTWQEWLWPFAPLSLTWVAAVARPPLRLQGAACAIGVLVYLFVAYGVLGDFDERGAYLLPLAIPAALLTTLALPARATAAAAAIGAVLAVTQVVRHDDHHLAAQGSGLREIAGAARPYLLVADPADFEVVFRYFPELRANADYWDAIDAADLDPERAAPFAPLLVQWLRERHDDGRPLLMSEAAERYLEDPQFTEGSGEAGPLLLGHLRASFEFDPVAAGDYRGYRLVPRR